MMVAVPSLPTVKFPPLSTPATAELLEAHVTVGAVVPAWPFESMVVTVNLGGSVSVPSSATVGTVAFAGAMASETISAALIVTVVEFAAGRGVGARTGQELSRG